jgi:hypothetical protein
VTVWLIRFLLLPPLFNIRITQLRIEEARARRGGTPGGKRDAKGQQHQQQQQGKKGPGQGSKPPQHHQQQHQQQKDGAASPAGPGAGAKPGGLQRRPSEQALDIQFGKIAVPAQGAERLRLKKGGKNLVGLLQKAEEKERRLKELQASEDGKAEAEAILWKDALKSAHGEKVLDNPKASRLWLWFARDLLGVGWGWLVWYGRVRVDSGLTPSAHIQPD